LQPAAVFRTLFEYFNLSDFSKVDIAFTNRSIRKVYLEKIKSSLGEELTHLFRVEIAANIYHIGDSFINWILSRQIYLTNVAVIDGYIVFKQLSSQSKYKYLTIP
jgi:hypothetical protein